MPVPIFEQPIIEQQSQKQPQQKQPLKEKISPWTIFLTILIIAVMITLGEFAFRDINELFNPLHDQCGTETSISLEYPYNFSRTEPAESVCNLQGYEQTRLILHADLAVPLILFSALIFLFIRGRKLGPSRKAIFYALVIFSGWLTARIVIETEHYFVKHHPLIGKYIVGMTIIIVLTVLIVFIQRMIRKKIQSNKDRTSAE